MGDKPLIDALRAGRNEAWRDLVRQYSRLVYHVVRRTLSAFGGEAREEDVEDVTYDFLQSLVGDGYRALGTIGPPHNLKAWLAVSARRRAIDFARKKRPAVISLDDRRGGDAPLGDRIAGLSPIGEDPMSDYREAVFQALKGLNPKERMIVQLFYLKGKKYREIAQIAGINSNSISPTLMRAVEKLQRVLRERNLLGTRT